MKGIRGGGVIWNTFLCICDKWKCTPSPSCTSPNSLHLLQEHQCEICTESKTLTFFFFLVYFHYFVDKLT